MTTKRESILDKIKTTLAGTTNVGTRIYRSKVTPLSRGETPALVIEPRSDNPDQSFSLPRLDWSLSVTVTVLSSGDVPDEQADSTVVSSHAKLMADLTIGGESIDIQPTNVTFEAIDGDSPIGVTGMGYTVRYRTEVDDITQ